MARKILLADDSVTAQNMGRRILTDAGYEVVTVNNGSAALKKIAEHKPDLIVLDVYMPGYGGLEVCQRLKENRDTARIPILLTVGKLEPFKADEARRVRADAFIVKPFEASELLTALTKLEDKIVPQPEAYKQGRFAKAIAAVEHITEKGDGFGDAETGWKDRLKFPGAKAPEPEPETAAAASTKHPELARRADFKPVEVGKDFERPIPAGLPADITPEEIAAITAAAAAFGGKLPTSQPEALKAEAKEPVAQAAEAAKAGELAELAKTEAAAPAATTQEAPAATFAAAPEITAAPSSEGAPTVPQVQEVPAAAAQQPAATAESEPAKESAKTSEEATEAKPPAEAPPVHKPTDADVLAALASIMPSLPSDGADGQAARASSDTRRKEDAAVAVATTQLAAVGALAGPRWIAEAVPVESDDAALILEQEMEKALAAMAAAEAAASVPGPVEASPVSFAAAPMEAAGAGLEAATSALAPVEPASTSPAGPETSIPESKAEAPAAPAPVEAVSETSATSQPEPATVVAAVASAEPAVPAAEATQPPVISEESAISEPKGEAAFAAAASAGPGMGEPARASEPGPQAMATPASSEAAPVQGESQSPSQVDAASAAAWESWRHVRDSVVGAELTSQIADAAATQLKDIQEQAAAAPTESAKPESTESAPSEAAPADSSSIASIVDSMLAELKPKLVEEIAKKMGSEKDKERKKKKKD